jgi:Alkylmercury lyase
MANPFSAIETPYAVTVAGQTYWANCAWDTFGIVAALHADEADIRSVCAATGAPVHLRLAGGAVEGSAAVVHFLVPFGHWYDDLVHT